MRKIWGEDRSNPFPAEEEAGCRNEQHEAPYDKRTDRKRGSLLRYVHPGFDGFFGKWGYLGLVALHYVLRIELEDLAISFQKRSVINASRQIGKAAFLETLEMAHADACFGCYLRQ